MTSDGIIILHDDYCYVNFEWGQTVDRCQIIIPDISWIQSFYIMHNVTLTNIPVKPVFTQLKDTQAIMQISPKNSNMTWTHINLTCKCFLLKQCFKINFISTSHEHSSVFQLSLYIGTCKFFPSKCWMSLKAYWRMKTLQSEK